MAYLVLNDYKKQIQSENLNQVISSDMSILSAAALTAQAEAISYLIQKYEVNAEFTNTAPWDKTIAYVIGQRATIDFPIYDQTTSYVPGDVCINVGIGYSNAGIGYSCIENTTGAFDASKWANLGAANDIYYAKSPNPEFNVYALYRVGDIVYWKGNKYTCKVQTQMLTHEAALQYGTYDKIPPPNIFPDDLINGAKYWGAPVAYSVPAGTLPTNTTYFTKGDNRDQQMLTYLIDIALYHAHSRIAAKNVPEKIAIRYMGRAEDIAIKDGKTTFPSYSALGWLQACAIGAVTPALPVKQPRQGGRIRWGGQVKNVNNY